MHPQPQKTNYDERPRCANYCMYAGINYPRIGRNLQRGLTLVLSLLLVAILTILAMTASQSSFLSYKSQNARTAFQGTTYELTQIQTQSALRVKNYIDSMGVVPEGGESLSAGHDLVRDIMVNKVIVPREAGVSENALTPLYSYEFPHIQVDVYIANGWLSNPFPRNDLQQFDAYADSAQASLTDKQYLYLQLHCISKPKGAQDQSVNHLVGDFRFEVAS